MPTFREDSERLNAEASVLRQEAATILDAAETVTDEIKAEFDAKVTEADGKEGDAKRLASLADRQDSNASAIASHSAPNARKTAPDAPSVGDAQVTLDPFLGLAKGINVAAGDERGHEFKVNSAIGELAQMVHGAGPGGFTVQAAAGTGMEQGVTSAGGALVPPAVGTAVWDRISGVSNSLLQYTDMVPIDPGNESIEFPALAETSRADGSRQGGIRGYWGTELGELTSSTTALRGVKWTPNELDVYTFVSDKLLRNSPLALGTWLGTKAADEMNFKIGDGIINGNGAGMPAGVLASAATIDVDAEVGQAAATIVTENIRAMWARMHTNARAGAVWFINQDCEPQLSGMTMDVGTGGVPVMLPAGGLSGAPFATIFGRPVVPIEYCATLGTSGDVILADLGYYGICVKGGVNAAQSIHLKFDFKQTAFRWGMEVDGQSWLSSAITPFKGTDTLSAFLTLATRS